MNKFVRNLLTAWRKLELPFSDETIIVAVSGGADSVSLALALHDLKTRKKLDLNFIIAHFNHQLRGSESENDAKFVQDLAEKLSFKFEISNPESSLITKKGNLEQNARHSRYEFLREVGEKHQSVTVLTAHTKNDQAETFLFNLIRGSGVDGLAGIPMIRFLDTEKKIFLARPLLNWAFRNDTEKFCLDNNIRFRLDAMNDDLMFSRVKIRKEVIPFLQKINPRIVDTLSKTANILRESAGNLQIDDGEVPEILSQNELKSLPKTKRMQVLRCWLKKHRGNLRRLDLKHFEAIDHLIYSRKSGRIVQLPTDEKVVKRDGKLFFEKTTVEKCRSDN